MTQRTDSWNPEQYRRFQKERAQPFFDLMSLVRGKPEMRVVDLGCGSGELTLELHRALGARSTLGLDSSKSMLAKAPPGEQGLSFAEGDIGRFDEREAYDLVFSNAAIQWLDGHAELLGRLKRALRPGGQLAIQMPANHDHPSHVIAAQVALEEPFRSALGGYSRKSPVLAPEDYSLILERLGFEEQQVFLRVYLHRLESREGVIEWVKGTLLTDYEKRLAPQLYARFLSRYREALFAELKESKPFPCAFKRILLHAACQG